MNPKRTIYSPKRKPRTSNPTKDLVNIKLKIINRNISGEVLYNIFFIQMNINMQSITRLNVI